MAREISIDKVDKKLKKVIPKQKTISLKTYHLTEYGEKLLELVLKHVLEHYARPDLLDIAYPAAKELVINATKANYKRVIYKKNGLDITNQEDYQKGLAIFKESLTEEQITAHKDDFKKYKLPVIATFYFNKYVLNIKVKNKFTLLPIEEQRIREKFRSAVSFSNLLDFFMEYPDDTEGAGMGLTMVGILLDQSNIDRHCFSLYSSDKYKETIAKLEIPLHDAYIPKRQMFEKELFSKNLSPEELRPRFRYTYKEFTLQDY